MRSIRPVLATIAFCVATSASIWIGWIYAGAGESADLAPPTAGRLTAGSNANPTVGLPRAFGAPSLLPDISSTMILPGMGDSADLGAQLNGFPTVSKEAIERASGYSPTDPQIPSSVVIPEKLGSGQRLDIPGSAGANIP